MAFPFIFQQDGGTLCIAGSHKIDPVVDPQDIIKAAYEDPTLLHHVVAPAGSTMVFFEVIIVLEHKVNMQD